MAAQGSASSAAADLTAPLIIKSQAATWHRIRDVALSYRRWIAIALGPAAALLIAATLDIQYEDDTSDASVKAPTYMLAIMAWVFIWWVTEGIPIAITALAPLFLLPFLQIRTAAEVSESYMNDTIFLLLGSFVLALALQHYNLHKRMALKILMWLGGDNNIHPWLLIFGFCVGPAFVSMWIHNTAAAVVMMPVGVGILHKSMEESHRGSSHHCHSHHTSSHGRDGAPSDPISSLDTNVSTLDTSELSSSTTTITIDDDPPPFPPYLEQEILQLQKLVNDFSKALILGISYSATIGGMATLTGTGVNLVLVGLYESAFPSNTPITYLQWFLFGFPLALLMLIFLWLLLCLYFCPLSSTKSLSSTLHISHIEEELLTMGPISYDETMVLIVFGILIVLWLTKSISTNFGWALLFNDYPGNGTITVFMITMLFIIPSKRYVGEKIMSWPKCKDLPWGLVLLFGGGYALADGMSSSGLSSVISDNLDFLSLTPYILITPIIAILTSVVTEFTSNLSTATIFVSLLAQVATSTGRHPLFLMIPATIGSQLSFMLPIATPPNAVGYSTGYLHTKDLVIVGLILKAFGIMVLSILMPTLGALVFQTNS